MLVKNSKQLPKVYYGLHMCEGVAEYQDAQVSDGFYRILIGEECLKNMDQTFSGRPVYVHHVDKVDLENIKQDADGWVIDSFYNQLDGKHWVKFLAFDRAIEAIDLKKWKLSNAYHPKKTIGGGKWHGVEYRNEIIEGEYEHLAIVPNPRYAESEILTEQEFKDYNSSKELELSRLLNSEGEGSMLEFYKKTKVEKIENAKDMGSMSVILPKSKREVELTTLVNEADEAALKKDNEEEEMANGEHHVMVGEDKMKLNDLIEKHMELKQAYDDLKKQGEEPAQEEKKDEEDKPEEKKKEDAEEPAKEEKKNKEEPKLEEKKENHFDTLRNANKNPISKEPQIIETGSEKIARGKLRYGSGK